MKTPNEIAEHYYSLHCDNTLDKEKYWIIPAMEAAMIEYKGQFDKCSCENVDTTDVRIDKNKNYYHCLCNKPIG